MTSYIIEKEKTHKINNIVEPVRIQTNKLKSVKQKKSYAFLPESRTCLKFNYNHGSTVIMYNYKRRKKRLMRF